MTDYRRPCWLYDFRLANGKKAYVPDPETRSFGVALKKLIDKKWRAPPNYSHLNKGGHIQALREHSSDAYFGRLDISNFFSSITKSRITRELKFLLGSYEVARRCAVMSTVPAGDELKRNRYVLPFGFVQSPVLASVCLHASHLGRCISRSSEQLRISVYVDDILISSNESAQLVEDTMARLERSAVKSKFLINYAKSIGPSERIEVFNVSLGHNHMEIIRDRFLKLKDSYERSANPKQKKGYFRLCPLHKY